MAQPPPIPEGVEFHRAWKELDPGTRRRVRFLIRYGRVAESGDDALWVVARCRAAHAKEIPWRIVAALVLAAGALATYLKTHRLALTLGVSGGSVFSFVMHFLKGDPAARAEELNGQFLRFVYADPKERADLPNDWMDSAEQ